MTPNDRFIRRKITVLLAVDIIPKTNIENEKIEYKRNGKWPKIKRYMMFQIPITKDSDSLPDSFTVISGVYVLKLK